MDNGLTLAPAASLPWDVSIDVNDLPGEMVWATNVHNAALANIIISPPTPTGPEEMMQPLKDKLAETIRKRDADLEEWKHLQAQVQTESGSKDEQLMSRFQALHKTVFSDYPHEAAKIIETFFLNDIPFEVRNKFLLDWLKKGRYRLCSLVKCTCRIVDPMKEPKIADWKQLALLYRICVDTEAAFRKFDWKCPRAPSLKQLKEREAELEADAIEAEKLANGEPVGDEQGGGSESGGELNGEEMDTS